MNIKAEETVGRRRARLGRGRRRPEGRLAGRRLLPRRPPVQHDHRGLGPAVRSATRRRSSAAPRTPAHPLSGGSEFTEPDFDMPGSNDLPIIAPDAHVRLVHPDFNGGARMLRRGYNFVDGSNSLGGLDAGLFFLAFVRNPDTHFIPIQNKMASQDALMEYLKVNGSALFAVPPGIGRGRVRRPGAVRLSYSSSVRSTPIVLEEPAASWLTTSSAPRYADERRHQRVVRRQVEVVGRLVEQQQLRCRVGEQQRRQGGAEPLAAGQGADRLVGGGAAEQEAGQLGADRVQVDAGCAERRRCPRPRASGSRTSSRWGSSAVGTWVRTEPDARRQRRRRWCRAAWSSRRRSGRRPRSGRGRAGRARRGRRCGSPASRWSARRGRAAPRSRAGRRGWRGPRAAGPRPPRAGRGPRRAARRAPCGTTPPTSPTGSCSSPGPPCPCWSGRRCARPGACAARPPARPRPGRPAGGAGRTGRRSPPARRPPARPPPARRTTRSRRRTSAPRRRAARRSGPPARAARGRG